MAYCRFSTNDFQCDAYVYEDGEGFTTHIARHRAEFAEELPPAVPFGSDAFLDRYKTVVKLYETAKQVKIDLPLAGESYSHDSAEETIKRLLHLRFIGYRFPETVITDIRSEAFPGEDNSKWYVQMYLGGDYAGSYAFGSLEEAEADLLVRKRYQVAGLYYEITTHPRPQPESTGLDALMLSCGETGNYASAHLTH